MIKQDECTTQKICPPAQDESARYVHVSATQEVKVARFPTRPTSNIVSPSIASSILSHQKKISSLGAILPTRPLFADADAGRGQMRAYVCAQVQINVGT